MRLVIEGQSRELIALKVFREAHHLPDTFSVALFEPKDFTGLAAIDKAGNELNQLRQGILDSVPQSLTIANALTQADTLQAVFRNGLYGINTVVGLKTVEVEYAVAGFGDVLRNWLYALIRARSTNSSPDFFQIYAEWLNASMRLSQQIHAYPHQDQTWQINIILWRVLIGTPSFQSSSSDSCMNASTRGAIEPK
jgi:hypothetical protein